MCTYELPRFRSCSWGTAWTHHLLKPNGRIKHLFVVHISKVKFKILPSNERKREVGPTSGLFVSTDCWEISTWKKENKNRITLLILEISNSKGCLRHGSCGQQHTDFPPLSGKLVMRASPFPRTLGKGKNNFGR